MLNFGIMHGNEYLINKVKRSACAFIEVSLFYAPMDRDGRKFVISILPGTRLSTGSTALLQCAFDLSPVSGVAPGIFQRAADSSDEGAKIWFSGSYKCQKSPKKIAFDLPTGG